MSDEQVTGAEDVREFKLSPNDQVALLGLTTHPGFGVLTAMMDAACRRAYAKAIKCDSADEKRVLALQKEARATDQFVSILRKAINWNVSQVAKSEAPKLVRQMPKEK